MLNQARKRILIVDDNPEFRRSLRKMLQKAGYRVSAASSVKQASALLSHKEFPLVLTDLHMPGKSGLDLLREVKEKSPESKVIMITVDGVSDSYTEAMNDGAYAFLNKPVKMQKILTYADMALNGQIN